MGNVHEAPPKTDFLPINKTSASDMDIQLHDEGDDENKDVPTEDDITQHFNHGNSIIGLRRRKLQRYDHEEL
jgi:hypothetical protein